MSQTTIDFSIDWSAFSAAAGADLANFSIVAGSNTPQQHTWGMLANSYVAATYDFHRGAALSSWVRASNTAGALTNVAASVDGHVLRRNGTALGYGVLAAGAFATGPGIVTFAMMDNGTACSVGGRSANSAGARADIAISEGEFVGRRVNVVGSFGATGVLNRAVSDLQVSSTSQTSIYSYAIPAGTVPAGRTIRLTWNGHFFNNDGANRSITLRLQFGGVTIWEDASATQTASANRRSMKIEVEVSAQSTTLQIANVRVMFATALAATTGVGDIAANNQIFALGESIDSTVDLANAQTLDLQVAIGPSITNAANVYVRRRGAYLELV